VKEQRADFAWAVVGLVQVEDGDFLADVDGFGFEDGGLDLVFVERLVATDFGGDAGGADDAAGVGVLEDEQVSLGSGVLGDALEAGEGIGDALGEQGAVLWEGGETDGGERGEVVEWLEVSGGDGADDHHEGVIG